MTYRALISVHDKTGLVDFAHALCTLGWELIASGGTAKAIAGAGLPVTTVEAFTRSPEILDGRVKTLHPAVHGGILARGEQDAADLTRVNSAPIDLVAVNLYPFEETVAKPGVTEPDAVEQIDIGGVALLRAAAKNFARVTVVCEPGDYGAIVDELRAGGTTTAQTRRRLAQKAFAHTAHYDSAIQAWLRGDGSLDLRLVAPVRLRYGENPHQQAELFAYRAGEGPLGGTFLQGKELSYNNILDLDAAWRGAVMFSDPGIVIVKHLSPCGIATGATTAEAFAGALASDPISAYGGVIASNRAIDADTVRAMGDLFVECIAAPNFTAEARELLAKRKNCRLLSMPNLAIDPLHEWRSVNRGILRQTIDRGDPAGAEWKVVSERQPTAHEMRTLRFAWVACQHVKSNSIVLAQGTATVGIGGGQPNRVDCVKIAVERAGARAKGSVMASDAFFPFEDSVQLAALAGVTAVAHPGGSKRDADSITAANKAGMAMVVTGARHFRH